MSRSKRKAIANRILDTEKRLITTRVGGKTNRKSDNLIEEEKMSFESLSALSTDSQRSVPDHL